MLSRKKKTLATVMVSGALLAGGIITTASTAHADPSESCVQALAFMGLPSDASPSQENLRYKKLRLAWNPDLAPPAERDQWERRYVQLSSAHETALNTCWTGDGEGDIPGPQQG